MSSACRTAPWTRLTSSPHSTTLPRQVVQVAWFKTPNDEQAEIEYAGFLTDVIANAGAGEMFAQVLRVVERETTQPYWAVVNKQLPVPQ